MTDLNILLVTLIMYMITIYLYLKFRINWILAPTIILWFVPIFIVENLFIVIFSVIMIIITIVIAFFSKEEEY